MRGGNVSPKTINNTLVPLKEMFKHALRWGYLRENPAAYVEKPRVPYKEMDFLTPEEVRLFLEHTGKRYALFVTAIMTGMRRGELLAMKWANLDWLDFGQNEGVENRRREHGKTRKRENAKTRKRDRYRSSPRSRARQGQLG